VVLDGLRRDDLLVVVHEQMPTDTTRWADWVLPAAMGMEVLDLHTSYWHRYLQLNRPALPPPGEAVSNPELFRRLARAVGLTDPALAASDEDLIRDALATDHPWLRHITWDRLRDNPVARVGIDRGARPFVEIPPPLPGGRIRLDPPPFVPNTDGRSSGAPDDAAYPFHLLSPSRRDTIKSTFGNMPGLSASLPPELLMHPDDVRRGGYRPGEVVEVVSAQGRVRMRLTASDVPGPGTVVSYAVTWAAAHGDRNVNRLTSQRLSDYGGGATFYSVRVAVRRVDPAERREPNDPGRVETGPGRDGTHLPGPATVNATIPTQGGDS
jgi:anaerobic selenocysteine-containing dehydrogenase